VAARRAGIFLPFDKLRDRKQIRMWEQNSFPSLRQAQGPKEKRGDEKGELNFLPLDKLRDHINKIVKSTF